ncbi:rho GTPase activator [Coprinopsis cinerea AmutBmut pab1-1]|nr:rho GTPase activator [Coprinopsis cinerea AmutBmut pab1-1]
MDRESWLRFRRYLNQLPEPVVQQPSNGKLRDAIMSESATTEEKVQACRTLIQELPRANQYLLLYVLDLLSIFARRSDKNLMSCAHLAAVFAHILLSHRTNQPLAIDETEHRVNQETLEFLIIHQDRLMVNSTQPPSSSRQRTSSQSEVQENEVDADPPSLDSVRSAGDVGSTQDAQRGRAVSLSSQGSSPNHSHGDAETVTRLPRSVEGLPPSIPNLPPPAPRPVPPVIQVVETIVYPNSDSEESEGEVERREKVPDAMPTSGLEGIPSSGSGSNDDRRVQAAANRQTVQVDGVLCFVPDEKAFAHFFELDTEGGINSNSTNTGSSTISPQDHPEGSSSAPGNKSYCYVSEEHRKFCELFQLQPSFTQHISIVNSMNTTTTSIQGSFNDHSRNVHVVGKVELEEYDFTSEDCIVEDDEMPGRYQVDELLNSPVPTISPSDDRYAWIIIASTFLFMYSISFGI